MRIFISGGCKNGKSTYAQNIAVCQRKENLPLYYIATMKPADVEDKERILRHKKEREGLFFETIEQPLNISEILKRANKKGSYLLDSTTALLANEMFQKDGWNGQAQDKVGEELKILLTQLKDIVIVSDYIYSDALSYSEETKAYQKGLAYLDKLCAVCCDAVLEICYGNVVIHKGKPESILHGSFI